MSEIRKNKSKGIGAGIRVGLCSDGGVAAIEFAFLAPILLLIITGVCQFTMMLGNYMSLEHAVGELEPVFREALLLREVQDLSYEEIARVIGVSVNTVKTRIHRARARLQQQLAEFR